MEYNGYKIVKDSSNIVVEGIRDFDPVHVFDCGQCFRWKKQDDGSYFGIVKDKVSSVSWDGSRLIISNSTPDDFVNVWYDYFDLGSDYGEIKRELCKDEIMKKAINFGYGIRILRQDIWEMLISFIISANNRIPMIMKTVENLSKMYGRKIQCGEKEFYTFPEAGKLSETELCELEVCRAGFRCKYIIHTSQMIRDGAVDLDGLPGASTGEARDRLMKLPGVGKKVADCVLLYSGTKYDVFPTDVWIKRVMEVLYFKREASLKEIQEFSRDYFGDFAGFAQQYLFYYARENKISDLMLKKS